ACPDQQVEGEDAGPRQIELSQAVGCHPTQEEHADDGPRDEDAAVARRGREVPDIPRLREVLPHQRLRGTERVPGQLRLRLERVEGQYQEGTEGEGEQDEENDVVRGQADVAPAAGQGDDRAHISHPRRHSTWKIAITQPTKKLIVNPIAAA